jgi:carbonic anhydrase
MIRSYKKLFDNNKKWVLDTNSNDAEFFNNLAQGQSPEFLWIGCSDSRVPANEVTGTAPGDIFVHRNIANMVILSVLDYSVNVLGVKHVMVVGHYGCGGVKAAMGNKQVGLIDNWLRNIKDVYRLHESELDAIEDEGQKFNRLVELNVQEQVFNLTKTSIVQNAWANGKKLQVHGLIFEVETGLLKDLNISVGDISKIESVFKFDLEYTLQ